MVEWLHSQLEGQVDKGEKDHAHDSCDDANEKDEKQKDEKEKYEILKY